MGLSGKYCFCGNSISSAGWQNGCEKCGFVPEWMGQLDVDHIDGDKSNNNEDNLMTLCANCHRLKTHIEKDYSRYLTKNNND